MKLVVSRPLDRCPAGLAAVADAVAVLTARHGATCLEGYDAHLDLVWTKPLGARAVAVQAVGRTRWVLDPAGAWAVGEGGDRLARVPVRPRGGMCLSAFAGLGDGFVFAWQQQTGTPIRPSAL